MAQQDRLQPSLLDRLTDDDPHAQEEPRERRVMSLRALREAVVRDLGWLLNTTDLGSTPELEDLPNVASSVLNYGLPALAGRTVSSLEIDKLEQQLRQSIVNFEPRLFPRTLKVRVVADESRMSHNALIFDIEGQIWAQPTPVRFLVRAEVDLEMGGFSLEDRSA